MSDYTRNDLIEALGLAGGYSYSEVTFTVGREDDTSWFHSYDDDTDEHAIAWVEWAVPGAGATDQACGASTLKAHLDALTSSGEFDGDYGITVTVAPGWLRWSGQLAA